MLLVDHQIRALCIDLKTKEPAPIPLIYPFIEGIQDGGIISCGLSHAGYDLRLGTSVLLFKNTHNQTINPKKFNDPEYRKRMFEEFRNLPIGSEFIIPPCGYILGHSLEHITIPIFLKGRCVGKSTLARSAIHVNTTPLEPCWSGTLTIEISNPTMCPATVFIGEGIAQLEFEQLSAYPETTYADKRGKYQNQGSEPIPSRTRE